MTIECYQSQCPFHSFQLHSAEGPFCFQPECQYPIQIAVYSSDEWCYISASHYFPEFRSRDYRTLFLKHGVDPEFIIHSQAPDGSTHFWSKKQPL